MPAGVSWGQYLKFSFSSIISMLAGAQLVHMYFKPLEDIDVYIERELEQTMMPTKTNK